MSKNLIIGGAMCRGCNKHGMLFTDTGLCLRCTTELSDMMNMIVGKGLKAIVFRGYLKEIGKTKGWHEHRSINPHTLARAIARIIGRWMDHGK